MKALPPNGDSQTRSTSGGAAAAGGFNYQAQVTAWWAARILLQTPAEVGTAFDLPATAVAARLFCETADSVDDIRIELSDGSFIFGQCKRSLQRSKDDPNSLFGQVFRQFIMETARLSSAQNQRRFVLFYEEYSGPLGQLSRVLNRYRGLPLGSAFEEAATSDGERGIAADLNVLLDNLFATPELSGLKDQRERMLRLSFVHRLAVSAGEAHYLGIIDALSGGLLNNPNQIHLVMRSLHELGDELIVTHGSVARDVLRFRLQGLGVALKDSVNLRADFDRLDRWSRDRIAAEEAQGRDRLSLGGQHISVVRPVVDTMVESVTDNSFLVVGEAGVGKTGCLLALARSITAGGRRVWYCAANSSNRSLQQIRNEATLEHSWEELFADSVSGIKAILIIDGLDGLRDTEASKAYRDLIALGMRRGLRVVASIRSFDLLYSLELRRLFAADGSPVCEPYFDDSFRAVKHIAVSDLDDNELTQVEGALPPVTSVFQQSEQLKDICRNLFFLNLMCDLLKAKKPDVRLTEITSRAELFDQWWDVRVESGPRAQECVDTLRSLVQTMVDQRSLSVHYTVRSTEVWQHLFSSSILRYPPTPPERLPTKDLVEFTHHFLFDHAAMKLFVEPRRNDLPNHLNGAVNWGLFLRPSLILFFRYAWAKDREEFWKLLAGLETGAVTFFHTIPAYLVVASEAASLPDLHPLLEEARWTNQAITVWRTVATARYHSLAGLFRGGRGDCWLELAVELISTAKNDLVHAGRIILACAADELPALSRTGMALLNRGSLDLIQHCRRNTGRGREMAAPIEWVCRTIVTDPESSVALIRELVSREQLELLGYAQARPVVHEVREIWKFDPSLAVQVYEAVFSFREADNSVTELGESMIIRLQSTRAQEYQGARYLLRERFSEFLIAHPAEATAALCRAMEAVQRREPALAQWLTTDTFDWDGRECAITYNTNGLWFDNPRPADDEEQMLTKWENYLKAIPYEDAEDTKWDSIEAALCLENRSGMIWRSLLKAACEQPQFYSGRIARLLSVPRVLFGPGTSAMAANCLRSFAPYMERQLLDDVQRVVLATNEYCWPGSGTPLSAESLKGVKARVLCAIPQQFRNAHVREFLAACDPGTIQWLEGEERAEDRISGATNVSWPESEDDSDLETTFLASLKTETITEDNIAGTMSRIRQIKESLLSPDTVKTFRGVPVENICLHALEAVACSRVPEGALPSEELFREFRDRLLARAETPPDSELRHFDEWPSFDIPDPLLSAAKGFACLVARREVLSDEWREVLTRMAHHPNPKVPFQLIERFPHLMHLWPDFVMQTVERWAQEAAQRGGRLALVSRTIQTGTMWLLRSSEKERTDKLIQQFFEAAHHRGSRDLRRNCGELMAQFHIVLGEKWAMELILRMTENLDDNIDEIVGFVSKATGVILQPITDDLTSDATYRRALDLLSVCLGRASAKLGDYFSSLDDTQHRATDDAERAWIHDLLQLFEHTASCFAFISEESIKNVGTAARALDGERLAAWWNRVDPVMKMLMTQPYPSVVYGLIRGLKDVASWSPVKALDWLAQITRTSEPFGITFESVAQDDTIETLAKLIVDDLLDLRSEDILSNIVEITDRYLRAGWPRAFQFAIQLDGIFR